MSYKEIKPSESFGPAELFKKIVELTGSDEFALRVTGISGGGGGGGDVNVIQLGGVSIAVGAGTVNTGTQRVVLATDVGLPATTKTSVTPSHSKVTVTGTTGTLVASNSSRKTVFITNTDLTNRVTLNFGGSAVLDTGLTLMPGSSYQMGVDDYFNGQINAISAGSSSIVSVMEF